MQLVKMSLTRTARSPIPYSSGRSPYVPTPPRTSRSSYVSTYSDSYRASSASRKYSTTSTSPTRTYSTSRRALPSGPGPLDAHGNKYDSNYNPLAGGSRPRRSSSTTRSPAGPLKANHEFGSTYDDDKYDYRKYTTKPLRSTNRDSGYGRDTYTTTFDRHKSRTNSISDIDKDLENLNISNTSTKYRRSGVIEDNKTVLDRNDYNSRKSDIKESYRSSERISATYKPEIVTSPARSSRSYNSSENEDTPSPANRWSNSTSRQDSSDSLLNGHTSHDTSKETLCSNNYNKSGIVGLRNLGNTCFMNSVLQCLANTKCLLEYCIHDKYEKDINRKTSSMKGALFKAYAELMHTMWKDAHGSVSPTSFKSQIQRFAPRFVGYNQQDSQEFLRYLLLGLHEDINRVQSKPKYIAPDEAREEKMRESEKAIEYWNRYLNFDNSKIVDWFVGQLRSTLTCTSCDYSSVTFDPFWDLSVPIPKRRSDTSIHDCLTEFMSEEVLDGDERPTCSKCKARRKMTKTFSIQKFPQILVLHLKRFSGERYRSKLSTNIDFPMANLNLSKYSAEEKGPKAVYNLYGVSNHSGTVYSGHYTAYVKHPYSGEWHHFSDTSVRPVSSNRVVSSEAYVLFYELASNQNSRL